VEKREQFVTLYPNPLEKPRTHAMAHLGL